MRPGIDARLSERLLHGPLAVWPMGEGTEAFSPERALATYFRGVPRQYSGSLFDSFAGGGDRADVAHRVTQDDLLALGAVNAQVPLGVAERLLGEPAAGELGALLRLLPTDLDLWDASDDVLAVAGQAWHAICAACADAGRPDRGWVVASKLLARKRPRLIPLYDEKVRRVVGLEEGAGWWVSLRHALREDGDANRIRGVVSDALRQPGVPGYISLLRALDVIVWLFATTAGRRTPAGWASVES